MDPVILVFRIFMFTVSVSLLGAIAYYAMLTRYGYKFRLIKVTHETLANEVIVRYEMQAKFLFVWFTIKTWNDSYDAMIKFQDYNSRETIHIGSDVYLNREYRKRVRKTKKVIELEM